jgi:hypothetical protein
MHHRWGNSSSSVFSCIFPHSFQIFSSHLAIFHLLRLLHTLLRRLTIQPQRHKRQPTGHRNPDPPNPHPRAANLPTPRPLVVRKVANGNLSLLVDVREEGAAVVDAEVEDAVLIGGFEGDAKDGGVGGLADGREVEALEGREHAEFELDVVAGGGDEGLEVVVGVFGDFDLEVLVHVSRGILRCAWL